MKGGKEEEGEVEVVVREEGGLNERRELKTKDEGDEGLRKKEGE